MSALTVGQLPGGHKWIGEDRLMRNDFINRAGAAGGKISFINWLSLSQLLVVLKKVDLLTLSSGYNLLYSRNALPAGLCNLK